MKENKLADLSMDFAVKSLTYADKVNGHYSLKNQFERSATHCYERLRRVMSDFVTFEVKFLKKVLRFARLFVFISVFLNRD